MSPTDVERQRARHASGQDLLEQYGVTRGRTITVRVDGRAASQGSHAIARGRVFETAKGHSAWRAIVRDLAAIEARSRQWRVCDGPVELTVVFYRSLPGSRRWWQLPDRIPDWDKLGRAVGDALSGVLYDDDKRVTDAHVFKRYAAPGTEPGAVIRVTRLVHRGD